MSFVYVITVLSVNTIFHSTGRSNMESISLFDQPLLTDKELMNIRTLRAAMKFLRAISAQHKIGNVFLNFSLFKTANSVIIMNFTN